MKWSWLKNKTLRPLLVARLVEGLLIAVLIGLVVIGSGYVTAVRREALVDQRQLEQQPDSAIVAASAQRQLQERQHDVDRINAYILPEDGIAELVGALEAAAGRHAASLEVTQVAEVVVFDASQRVVPPTGPLKEIRLSVTATGDPPELIALLHELEHLPYLTSVPDWSVRTEAQGARGSSAVIPNTPPGVPAPPGESVALPTALLEAEILISVHNNDN